MTLTKSEAAVACRQVLETLGWGPIFDVERRTGMNFHKTLEQAPERFLIELIREIEDDYVMPAKMALSVNATLREMRLGGPQFEQDERTVLTLDETLLSSLSAFLEDYEPVRRFLRRGTSSGHELT